MRYGGRIVRCDGFKRSEAEERRLVATTDDDGSEQLLGRRSRKLQLTRSSLARSALDLFKEHGFDAVTVSDIADRSDVDPSTFFRHFHSKESVLFTDMDSYVERIRPSVMIRPKDERLLDTLHAVTLELVKADAYDSELENLRAELTESSSELSEQVVVYRERLASDLAQLIGEHLGIDEVNDMRPYLAATLWVAAFDWYRRQNVSSSRRVEDPRETVDELAALVQAAGQFLLLPTESCASVPDLA
jgi:AcrR family transcriptional regulator